MNQIAFDLVPKLRKTIWMIWHQNDSPSRRARGIAVGVFSGCFPFFGLQTIMGVFLASIFKGNLFLAAVGTWISNPLTYVPLYLLNYKIGNYLMGARTDPLQIKDSTFQDIWGQGWFISSRLIIGSACVGFIMSLIIGIITYNLFKLYYRDN
tara:strand:- start:22884 stop:23339 length:456 start_codon:yes stop_codon:yes gene_type:complete